MRVPQDLFTSEFLLCLQKAGKSLSGATFPELSIQTAHRTLRKSRHLARFAWKPAKRLTQNGDKKGIVRQSGLSVSFSKFPSVRRQNVSTDPSHCYYFWEVFNFRIQHEPSYDRKFAPMKTWFSHDFSLSDLGRGGEFELGFKSMVWCGRETKDTIRTPRQGLLIEILCIH